MALTDLIRGRQVVAFLTNKSGGSVAAGDVVIIDTGNDAAFTTTTSGQSTSAVGVVQESIANNAAGRVAVGGYVPLVNVPASVTRGHFLETHTVVKQGTGNSSRRTGSFGQFLTGGTTPSARLFGQVDITTPGSGLATDTLADAKGDLFAATAADTISRLAVGANDLALIAASGEATGLKWAHPVLSSVDALIGANVTMVNANTFYDGPSGSFVAGKWRIDYKVLVGPIVTTSQSYAWTARLWDGSTIYDETVFDWAAAANLNGEQWSMGGLGEVVLGSTTTLKVSVACNRGSSASAILRNPTVNSGASNTGSHMNGIRIA